MSNLKSNLGRQIRKYRKKQGLSQEVLAEKIGIAPNNLGKIERGQNFVTDETLEKIVQVLAVKTKDLFDDEFQIDILQMKKELVDAINSGEKVELLYKFYKSVS